VLQSPQVLRCMAEGEAKGELKAATKAVLIVLAVKYGPVPADLENTIRATTDLAKLDQWHTEAVRANSLADFRQQVGM
jgi:hypothetical protein